MRYGTYDSEIDVRILTLKKDVMDPKSTNNNKEILSTIHNNNQTDIFISSHYFDYLEFSQVYECNTMNFMEKAYENIELIRNENNRNKHKIQQCIIMFQYASESNGERVKKFWNKKISHLFLTMIKISGCNAKRLKEAKNLIENLLDQSGISKNNYLLYYTFDFSNLILIAKNLQNNLFQDILWKINYELISKTGRKIIRDTITLFGIHQECINRIISTENQESLKNDERFLGILNNKINVQINLGVQDPSVLLPIRNHLLNDFSGHFYMASPFGRRDFTIELHDVDMYDVIKFYSKVKAESKKYKEDIDKILTMKILSSVSKTAYIKSVITERKNEAETDRLDLQKKTEMSDFDCSDNVDVTMLSHFVNKMSTIVKKYQDCSTNYSKIDISEIYHSIDELSRNFFSEEFLLCICHAFYVFLEICISKCKENKSIDEHFVEFQRDFFSSINMLSHCTMHGEKCFVQAAPFSALLIDVPPRIIAFYTAIALKVEKILQRDEKQLFSFMFIPGFRSNIYVRPISCGSDADNRLIIVYINEKMMYNPYKVVCTMVHEIAHFVGSKTRCRETRLENIVDTIVKYFMFSFYQLDGVFDVAEYIRKRIVDKIKQSIPSNEANQTKEYYLSNLYEFLLDTNFLIDHIIAEYTCPSDFQINKPLDMYINKEDLFYQYILNIKNENSSNPSYYEEMVYSIIFDTICNNYYDISWLNDYFLVCEEIIGSYREAYSDLILCKLTGISPKEYIKLLNEQLQKKEYELDINKISADYLHINNKNGRYPLELVLRITAIFYVYYKSEDCVLVTNDTNDPEIKLYNMILTNLINYLIICKEQIDKHIFSDSIKELIKKMSNLSEDTFYSIYTELTKYKEEIIKIVDVLEESNP